MQALPPRVTTHRPLISISLNRKSTWGLIWLYSQVSSGSLPFRAVAGEKVVPLISWVSSSIPQMAEAEVFPLMAAPFASAEIFLPIVSGLSLLPLNSTHSVSLGRRHNSRTMPTRNSGVRAGIISYAFSYTSTKSSQGSGRIMMATIFNWSVIQLRSFHNSGHATVGG